MPLFKVVVSRELEVEAKDADEAEDKALDSFLDDYNAGGDIYDLFHAKATEVSS